ncbi:DNA polymerase I [hydrothermal vent metagenome]|uniref:DNA-directed DNA polymerase n=1 Tax=hydrothermal vent metagenome TaxID=652676 RepID=A0A3B0VQJ8_9ZZZZ
MSNSSQPKKLFIIDGSACIYRAFHAIPVFMTGKGQPTNAVYGFTQTLRKILAEHSPDYVVIAYDSRGPTFRHRLLEEYKATRPSMPDELSSQIPLIKRMVEAFSVASLEMQGFEADDIIATVVREARSSAGPLHVSVVTGDKDMYQLVDDDTDIYDYSKGAFIREAEVRGKFGVGPAHVVDMLGLAGDKSDNIPGVAGIGVKTAAKLINAYGTIEEMLGNLDSVSPERIKKKLAEHREDALLSKRLATLDAEVPLDFNIEDFSATDPDLDSLSKILRELEFVRLIKELIPERPVESFVEVVRDRAGAERLLGAVKKNRQMAVAAMRPPVTGEKGETTGIFELAGIGVAASDSDVYYLPLQENINYLEVLKAAIEDESVMKYAPAFKPLYKCFAAGGVKLRGAAMDISVASYLLGPGHGSHEIDDVAGRELDQGLGAGRDSQPSELAGARARAALRLVPVLTERLEEQRQLDLFRDMELPLVEILASMERAGIRLDSSVLERLTIEMAGRLTGLEAELYELAGYSFNINSPKQLSKLLFEDLGLTPVKKTKTGFSTDESVLAALSAHHAIAQKIIEYRKVTKLKSTYVDSLLQLVNKDDGRVHTTFNQTVTATGRLSSSRPNLQNIPVKGEYADQIRRAFVARERAVLICADYSQIELRLVAHLSEDPVLVDSFLRDEDIHTRTAAEVFGIMPGLVTGEMRRRAKAINFGIIYGMGAHGLAAALDIPVKEAGDYIKEYFDRYKGVRQFIGRTIEEAAELGYTETIFGRRRQIPELQAGSEQVRRLGERMATNTPVQGAAADMIKLSMIKIDKRLGSEAPGAEMLLQIHDELIFEVPLKEADIVKALVEEEMEGVVRLKVPVKVNVTRSQNWCKSS